MNNKKFTKLIEELNSKYGDWSKENPDLLKSADEAIKRMKDRKEETIEEWAERLTNNSAKIKNQPHD